MKTIIAIIVILLVGWGVYALVTGDGSVTAPVDNQAAGGGDAAGGIEIDEREVKTFTVSGKPFSFTPNEIRVKEGDTVRIVFQNEQGTHDWVIDEFDARTQVLQAGESETIQFFANKKGSFEYYCSVGNHREMGMKGTLVVE